MQRAQTGDSVHRGRIRLHPRHTLLLTTTTGYSLAGGVYSTVECFLEKLRGKKDMRNAVASGFTTGEKGHE